MEERESIILTEIIRQFREKENSGMDPFYIDNIVEYALCQGLIVSTLKRTDYAFGEKASCCAIDLDNYQIIHFNKEEFARLFGTEL